LPKRESRYFQKTKGWGWENELELLKPNHRVKIIQINNIKKKSQKNTHENQANRTIMKLNRSHLAYLAAVSVVILLFGQVDRVQSTSNKNLQEDPIQPIYLSKQDHLAPGKNTLNDESPVASSFSPKKLNSNKEFVFGDEEEDDEEKPIVEVASSDTNMMNSQPIESEMTNQNGNNDSEQQQQQQQQEEESSSSEQKVENSSRYEETDGDDDETETNDDLEEEEEKLITELKRNQRVDTKHSAHDKNLPGLLKFNKMAELQRKLLELSEKKINFDYDILINDDIFENNKNKLKNFPRMNKLKSFNDDQESNAQDQYQAPAEEEEEEIQHNKEDTITVEELLSQLETKLKTNDKAVFMKPILEIKEQIYLEGISNKKPGKTAEKPTNSFFNKDNEEALNDAFEMTGEKDDQVVNEDLVADVNQTSNHLAANPSFKQKSDYTHSGLDSKFETIKRQNDYLFLFVVAGCTLAGVLALLAASVCWYTVAKSSKASKSQMEFDSSKNSMFGIQNTAHSSGSVKSNSSGDKKLALSAQMYHYQHQKEQMIAMEKANNETKPDDSDNSDDETPEGDYTVYECPGLAPTGEMEVKNPLFKEELTGSNSSLNKIQPPPSYSTLTLTTTTVVNETVQPGAGEASPKHDTEEKK